MVQFTFWDILRNLLLAAQWTVLLSLIAFIGGAIVGLIVCVARISKSPAPPLAAAAIALTLYTSAFLGEIWRGCVEAIPKGQWEASASLALTYPEQIRYVILPQAMRIAVAPTVGFAVQVVKGTALASIIGFVELTKAGTMINNATFQSFLVYGLVALLYFALCFPLSLLSRRLERRLNVARAS
jgi:polar amino acid transport system permease protein